MSEPLSANNEAKQKCPRCCGSGSVEMMQLGRDERPTTFYQVRCPNCFGEGTATQPLPTANTQETEA